MIHIGRICLTNKVTITQYDFTLHSTAIYTDTQVYYQILVEIKSERV